MYKRSIQLLALIALINTAPAFAATCSNPDGEPGVILYNSIYGTFQGCTPTGWHAFHGASCPAGDACDAPGAFGFEDETGAALSTLVMSDIIQITGLDREASVEINGDGVPEFRICDSSDCTTEVLPWGSVNKYINNGEYLQLRMTSSDTAEITHSATITINGTNDQWDVTTEALAPPGPTNCDNIGDICGDGSVYAGTSSAGNAMYTTPADAATALSWGSAGIERGTFNTSDGEPNTATLSPFGENAHPAAYYCANLYAHGADDWYLPSIGELVGLFTSKGLIGGFSDASYWSSTEIQGNFGSFSWEFTFGNVGATQKQGALQVRCVRK